jgi:hypothetical protein
MTHVTIGFRAERLAGERCIKADLRPLMQLEWEIREILPVWKGRHHSDSFYDGRWMVGFIVQKNNAKSNSELKIV